MPSIDGEFFKVRFLMIFVFLVFSVNLVPSIVSGYPFDQNQLPGKGRSYFGCLACHLSDSGGGLTMFGTDYLFNNFQFDDALEAKDSDGDGFSNLEELSGNAYQVTNPGDPLSFPGPIPSSVAWLLSLVVISTLITGGFFLINGRLSSTPQAKR